MTTRTHRRSPWRRAVGFVVVAVLGSVWPAHAESPASGECGYGPCTKQTLIAFGLEYFPPEEKTISYGDTLDFFNTDLMAADGPGHTVTHLNLFGGPPRFDTGVVPVGRLVNIAGVEDLTPQRYLFFCRVHPNMKGKLHIVARGQDIPVIPG